MSIEWMNHIYSSQKKKNNKGFDRNELKLFQSPKQQEVKNNNEREKAFQKHKLEQKKKGE